MSTSGSPADTPEFAAPAENLKYTKYDYEYKFSSCPAFKFPNEPVKTYTSKNKPNKDYLNSTADFE